MVTTNVIIALRIVKEQPPRFQPPTIRCESQILCSYVFMRLTGNRYYFPQWVSKTVTGSIITKASIVITTRQPVLPVSHIRSFVTIALLVLTPP